MFNQTPRPAATVAGEQRHLLGWPRVCRAIGLLAFSCMAAAQAQTNDLLLDLLVKKGIVSQNEAKELRVEADKLKSESEALKTNNAFVSASKWKIGNAINSMELFGDVRFRYEARDARTPVGGRRGLR